MNGLAGDRLTVRGAETPGCRDHGERRAVKGSDVVHVGVDVGVWRAEGGLRGCSGVPMGGDPDEGQV